MEKLLKFSIYISALLLIALLLLSIKLGYQNSISELIELFKNKNIEAQLKSKLSENNFHIIQGLIFIFALSLFVIKKYSLLIIDIISFYFKDVVSSLLKSIKVLYDKHNVFIIFIPTVSIIYYGIVLPISYDEAWTYLKFASKNPLVSLTYYPAPNNHILYSLLLNVSYFIFPSLPLLSLRLPAIIISFFTYLIGIYSIKKHYNKKISIASVGIFSVLFMNIYYGYMSRGYGLILLVFITSFHFILNLIKNPNNFRDWFWLTIFSILGFFTIPSYLYAFVILNSIIFFFSSGKYVLKTQIKFLLSTILIVVFLYLPTIFVSGLNSLINNKFVLPISRNIVFTKMPTYLSGTIQEIFGLNVFICLITAVVSLLILYKDKDWFHIKLFTLFLIIPEFLILIQSVMPPSRTFIYYGFIIVFMFCISMKYFLEKSNINTLLAIVICLQLLFVFNFNNNIYIYEKYSIFAKSINSKIVKDNNSYLVNSDLFDTYLFYSLKVNHVNNCTEKKIRKIKISADTINNYKYIIIDIDKDETKKKKPKYINEYFKIY